MEQNDVSRVPGRRDFRPRTIREIQQSRAEGLRVGDGPGLGEQPDVKGRLRIPKVGRPVPEFRPARVAVEADVPSSRSLSASLMLVGGVWLGLLLVGFSVWFFWAAIPRAHHSEARDDADARVPVTRGSPPYDEIRKRLDRALLLSKSGNASEGWDVIRGISSQYAGVPSLAYAEALVAFQSQRPSEALHLADLSIQKGERVADSLSLLAAIRSSQAGLSGGEREKILRAAAEADPMNPAPLIELAALLVSRGDDDEAESFIRSAGARLLPVDSQEVVEASLGILRLKRSAGEGSTGTAVATPGGSAADFAAAYAAMKRGDFDSAGQLLESARNSVSPEVFDYLIKNSPIRDFALQPGITRFY